MKAEATIAIDGEDLVVSGEVTLPRILDHHAFERSEVIVTGARLDTLDEPPITRDHEVWTTPIMRDVEYALYEDAVNSSRR